MFIRKMSLEDYESVYSLRRTAEGMSLNNIDDTKEGIARFLERNPRTCYVAESEETGLVKGAILCGHDGRRGYIYHLAVDVADRGHGVGRDLVEKALYGLKREGISKVALIVFDANNKGNDFWESIGFTKRSNLVYRNQALLEIDKL